jgi:hypothetical protein
MIKPIKVPTIGVRQRALRQGRAIGTASALAGIGGLGKFMVGVQNTRSMGVRGWRIGQANNHAQPHLCDGRVAVKPMNKPVLNAAQQPHPHNGQC